MLSTHFSITHDGTTRSLRSLSRFSLWWASFFSKSRSKPPHNQTAIHFSRLELHSLQACQSLRSTRPLDLHQKAETCHFPVASCLSSEVKVSGNWRRLVCSWSSREVKPQFNDYMPRFFRLIFDSFLFLPIFVWLKTNGFCFTCLKQQKLYTFFKISR